MAGSGRLSRRWTGIRKSKANLVLVAAGCLLLVLSAAWRLAIAPAIRVVATDFDQLLYYEGTLTSYVGGPGVPAPSGGEPSRVQVILERRLFSRIDLSSPDVSAVEEDARLFNRDTAQDIYKKKIVYRIDRRSAEILVPDPKAPGQFKEGPWPSLNESSPIVTLIEEIPAGYYIVFPFDTPEKELPYWSELTKSSHPAKFVKTAKLEGVYVYDFRVEYHAEPAEPPEGFPQAMTGAELKALLGMPELDLSDDAAVTPSFEGAGTDELSVEPSAGTIMSIGRHDESLSLKLAEPMLTQVVWKLEYAQSKSSVTYMSDFAKDEQKKIKLQFIYIPVLLALVGLASLLIGAFAGTGKRL